MSAARVEPVLLPPITCQPWCEEGDGHTRAGHPDDQYCSAGYLELELSREREQIGENWHPKTAIVSLQADPFADAYLAVLVDAQMTRAEARRLGEHLIHLAELA